MSRSELIWERVKGALGVPPELDIDWDESLFEAPPGDSAIDSEDESSSDHGSFGIAMSGGKLNLETSGDRWLTADHDITATASPISHSHPDSPSLPPVISIEPILAPSDGAVNALSPPPLSLPAALASSPGVSGDGLGNISEDAEEEEGASSGANAESEVKPDSPQIQGIRISTTPLVSSPPRRSFSESRRALSFSNPNTSQGLFIGGSLSQRSSSFGSLSSVSSYNPTSRYPLSAAESRLKFGRENTMNAEEENAKAKDPERQEDDEDDEPYDPVAERGPGNPLFPSNFARLGLGPTLGK